MINYCYNVAEPFQGINTHSVTLIRRRLNLEVLMCYVAEETGSARARHDARSSSLHLPE